MNLLPPNPKPFDYFHAIRALASREGSKAIFDLADAAMSLPEPKGGTPETDAAICRYDHPAWTEGRKFTVDEKHVVLADFARTLERQRNETRAERDALADALRGLNKLNLCGRAYEEIESALASLNPTP